MEFVLVTAFVWVWWHLVFRLSGPGSCGRGTGKQKPGRPASTHRSRGAVRSLWKQHQSEDVLIYLGTMLEDFPIFSCIRWRKHSGKVLTDERGRCLWRQAGRLSPCRGFRGRREGRRPCGRGQVSGGGRGGVQGLWGLILRGLSKGLTQAKRKTNKQKTLC